MQETRLHMDNIHAYILSMGYAGLKPARDHVNREIMESLNASKIAPETLSLKEVFLSRIVVPWQSEPPRKTIFATKCLGTALSCASVVPHFIIMS